MLVVVEGLERRDAFFVKHVAAAEQNLSPFSTFLIVGLGRKIAHANGAFFRGSLQRRFPDIVPARRAFTKLVWAPKNTAAHRHALIKFRKQGINCAFFYLHSFDQPICRFAHAIRKKFVRALPVPRPRAIK